ncbi:MAG TPA: M28 family peptidase [Bryobacteraceae bacterium]|jgi:Zn-dependent M28 family amino/carboxypeptidase
MKSIGIAMITCRRSSACLVAVVLSAAAAASSQPLSAARIREHVRFLSSDLLEGRGVGVRGGDLATEYLATQFALAGAQPAGEKGTYFQRVPLVGVETAPAAQLSASSPSSNLSFAWLTDWVGQAEDQKPETDFEGDAIFVGHGIAAPEWNWDDFKGVDVRGKVLVLFTNEPTSTDPKFFDGRALTYYGRWVYKYEEALRRGATAAIIIHTTPTAGYGWDVVRSSWGREDLQVKLAPGEKSLALAAWVSRDAGEKLLALAGKNVDDLLKAADSRDFRPIPLGIRIRGAIPSKVRDIESRNVAALVPGNDPKLKDEVVVYTAHWDHLGKGEAVKGDDIYNGAVDNATGCGILLELARAWAARPQKPRRSALFVAVTGEEGGLRGSEFYASHPLIPPAKTAIDLNYDAIFPWGRIQDVVLNGAERTSVYPLVQATARRLELTISPDSEPEQGSYFRSDHFSFARVGIPAFSIDNGSHYAGKSPDFFKKSWDEFNADHYHQPSDEFHPDWDFTALEQAAEFGLLLGTDIANQDRLPDWKPGDQFHR